MTISSNRDQILSEITKVQEEFSPSCERMNREAATARIAGLSIETTEGRAIIINAVRKLYTGVIWDDDIRGSDISDQMRIEALRFRNASEK